MKKLMKAFFASFALMVAVFVVPSVADAAVTGLRQTDTSTTYVEFSWDADPLADCYKVSWSPNGMTWSEPSAAYSPQKSIYGLSAGTTYLVRVASVAKSGVEISSNTLEVVTAPNADELGTVVASGITESSISYSWMPATGATGYVIVNNDTKAVLGTTVATNYTLTGLAPATWYSINIYPVRVSSTGYMAQASYAYSFNKTLESLSNGANNVYNVGVRISNASPAAGTVTFSTSTYSGVLGSGLEVQLCNMKGKKVKTIRGVGMSVTAKVKKNTPFKYRARYYYTDATGKRVYGAYTGFRYFWNQTVNGKKISSIRSSSAKFKASWAKVAGAKGYKVYISTTKEGKYKLAKKLGKNSKSTTITKYGRSRLNRFTTYYVKIVAQVKAGKKTVTNDAQYVYFR